MNNGSLDDIYDIEPSPIQRGSRDLNSLKLDSKPVCDVDSFQQSVDIPSIDPVGDVISSQPLDSTQLDQPISTFPTKMDNTPDSRQPSDFHKVLSILENFYKSLVKIRNFKPIALFEAFMFRGVSQVYLINNSLTGLIHLIAFYVYDPWLGIMVNIGMFASTATAIVLRLDYNNLRDGIYGFNGVLVAAGIASYCPKWIWYPPLCAIIFASWTTFIGEFLRDACRKYFDSPAFTLPFNVMIIVFVGFSHTSTFFRTTLVQPLNIESLMMNQTLPVGETFLGGFISIAQVDFIETWPCTILIFVGLFVGSPIMAMLALVGGELGTWVAVASGFSFQKSVAGVWGFNTVLTAMGLGLFYEPSIYQVVMLVLAIIFTVWFQALMSIPFSFFGFPVCTIPFCVTSIIFLHYNKRFGLKTQSNVSIPEFHIWGRISEFIESRRQKNILSEKNEKT